MLRETEGTLPVSLFLSIMSTPFQTIVHLFNTHGESNYIGEPVTQRHHMEQAAYIATTQGLRNEIIIAALLHDIGHLLHTQHPSMGDLGVMYHEYAGANYLRSLNVNEDVCLLVQNHVNAKRYLVTKDPNYLSKLSPASQQTFQNFQGGVMSPDELAAFESHPSFKDFLIMRTLDEGGKQIAPTTIVPKLETYESVFNQCLAPPSSLPRFPVIPKHTPPTTTAEQLATAIDLSNKTILITGGTGGLGYECARVCLKRGAHVLVTGRDENKAKDALTTLRSFASSPDKVTFFAVDFESFPSVRTLVKEIKSRVQSLDILICNAGVMAPPERILSKENYELQFTVNYLSHFILTLLLLPLLRNHHPHSPARVVMVGALAHKWYAKIKWDDLSWDNDYEKMKVYAHSKTALHLFAYHLSKREPSIRVYSLHPGVIMTGLQRYFSVEDKKKLRLIDEKGNVAGWLKNVEQGASTILYAAIAPELTPYTGLYLDNNAVVTQFTTPDVHSGMDKGIFDSGEAEKLWKESLKWCHVTEQELV